MWAESRELLVTDVPRVFLPGGCELGPGQRRSLLQRPWSSVDVAMKPNQERSGLRGWKARSVSQDTTPRHTEIFAPRVPCLAVKCFVPFEATVGCQGSEGGQGEVEVEDVP